MSYLVLARKYRPQTFEDVVGQTPVSRTLANALSSNRVAHGYIFSGPRGVGKTTTARILAKCLNCVKGPTTTPCNACDACITISEGSSTDDVLEIDGASNRGIDQIRELRESAKYAPARSRYRIYIIDEAHQITKDAFGALLKTLEEPPPHVVFMMATTEVQKIPAPILSRCQRFSLRPISAELVFKHLQEICKKEKIKVEEAALADIVRFVEGSLRDALSLLDQALVFSPDGITATTVRELLGLLPLELIQQIAGVIQDGEPAAILKSINDAVKNGVDLMQLGKDLQAYYHDLMLTKAGVEDAFKVNNPTAKAKAAEIDFPTLERNIRLIARLLDDMRNSETPRALFEVYALRLGQKTIDPRVVLERLERISGAAPAPAAPPSSLPAQSAGWRAPAPQAHQPTPAWQKAPAPPSAPPAVPASTPTMTGAPRASEVPPQAREAVPAPAGANDPQSILNAWADFVADVTSTKVSLGSALEDAKISIENNRVVLTFSRSFSHDTFQRSSDVLRPIMTRHFGGPVTIDSRIEKTPPKPASAVAAPAPARPAPPSETPDTFVEVKPDELNPDAQRALKHFPGVVKKERK